MNPGQSSSGAGADEETKSNSFEIVSDSDLDDDDDLPPPPMLPEYMAEEKSLAIPPPPTDQEIMENEPLPAFFEDPTSTYPNILGGYAGRPIVDSNSEVIQTQEQSFYLKIVVIPYFNNELLFMPIVPGKWEYKHEDEKEVSGRGPKIRHKWRNRIKRWGTSGPRSFKFKLHKLLRSRTESESAHEKFFKRLPGQVRGFQFIHPVSITAEEILAQVSLGFRQNQAKNLTKVVIFGALLPVAFVIDLMTFGFVLTLTDLAAFCWSTKSLSDSTSLMTLIDNGAFIFEENGALTEFDLNRRQSLRGIPTDEDIEVLCARLGVPGMSKTVKKVRNRQLKKQGIRVPRASTQTRTHGRTEQSHHGYRLDSFPEGKPASAPDEELSRTRCAPVSSKQHHFD